MASGAVSASNPDLDVGSRLMALSVSPVIFESEWRRPPRFPEISAIHSRPIPNCSSVEAGQRWRSLQKLRCLTSELCKPLDFSRGGAERQLTAVPGIGLSPGAPPGRTARRAIQMVE